MKIHPHADVMNGEISQNQNCFLFQDVDMLISAVKLPILIWVPIGIDLPLEPASSDQWRNCRFWHLRLLHFQPQRLLLGSDNLKMISVGPNLP